MRLFDFFRKKIWRGGSGEIDCESESGFATTHCFVLCRTTEPEDLSRAGEVVDEVFGLGYSAEITGEGRIISVTHGNDSIGMLVHAPIPIPTQEAEEKADRNFLWPNGRDEAAKHRSHVIIANISSGNQTPVQSAILLSRLTLVALKLFDGIGVYWGNANVSNSRDVFEDFCKNMSEEHLPVPMWLRLQVVRASEDEIGMYTLGMHQFGLMEIEVDRCRMELWELSGFVADMARYLIQRGPVIADEDTTGGSENQRILVRHWPSMIDDDRRVYKVIMDE